MSIQALADLALDPKALGALLTAGGPDDPDNPEPEDVPMEPIVVFVTPT